MAELRVGERTVEITHPDKVLFPDDGITKLELAEYYAAVAERMLPHVAGRPANLQRFPSGIGRPGFMQQELPGSAPDWIPAVTVPRLGGGEVRHAVLDDAAALVWAANQNAITPHVWLARAGDLEHPDQLMFDLDPPGADDPRVRHATLRLGALLAELGLPSFVKTSGSRGYHVVVPLDASAGFDTVRAFAEDVGTLLARHHARHLTTEMRKAARRGRILVDTLRNTYAHTAVAAYAVRARQGAPVACPVPWSELEDPAMRPDRYRLRDLARMLEGREDPWRDLARRATGLTAARARLDALLAESRPSRRAAGRRLRARH